MNRAHDTPTRRGRDEGGSRGSAPAAMRHRSGRPATTALSATPPAQVGAEPHGVTRGGDVDRPSAGRHGYPGDSHFGGPAANQQPLAAAPEGERRRTARRTRAG
jgi:hypothetical protein